MTFEDFELEEADFELIGAHLASARALSSGKVGEADTHLFDLPTGVDTARAWMAEHRRPTVRAPAGS